MAATTYDASELYPYYEKALQKTLMNRRLIPSILYNWSRLAYTRWPQEYRDILEKMEKENIIRFGNFPLLIIDDAPHALFWKQVAHILGATYISYSIADHLLTAWREYTFNEFFYSPLNIDYLNPLIGVSPLLCIFGDMATPDVEYVTPYCKFSTWIEIFERECSYGRDLSDFFYSKASSSPFEWRQSLHERTYPTLPTFWKYFSIPSAAIRIENTMVSYTSLADEETYIAYLENVCTSLASAIVYLQQQRIMTLPLSVPNIPQEEIARAKERWPRTFPYYIFPPMPRPLEDYVKYNISSFKEDHYGKIKIRYHSLFETKNRVSNPGLLPAPQIQASPTSGAAPVPSQDAIPDIEELEKEIQRRLALKRA